MTEATSLDRSIRLGHGRAVVRMRSEPDARRYRDVIRDACLHNLAHDRQTEPTRGLYLYHLIEATREREFYRPLVFDALKATDEAICDYQLAELVRHWAANGDREARTCLYAMFDGCTESGDFDPADQLIALDGVEGFIVAAQRYEAQVRDKEVMACWSLCDALLRAIGKEAAEQAIEEAVARHRSVAELAQRVREDEADRAVEKGKTGARRSEKPSYDTVRQAIYDGRPTNLIRRWRRLASPEELLMPAQELLQETDPARIERYVKLFYTQPFPLNPAILIDLTSHPDARIPHAAFVALSQLESPQVREFAARCEADPERAFYVAALLERNYAPGDELRIERIVRSEPDADRLHFAELHVFRLLEAHPNADGRAILEHLYEYGPCSVCRSSVVTLLRGRGAFPEAREEEYRYDCYPLAYPDEPVTAR